MGCGRCMILPIDVLDILSELLRRYEENGNPYKPEIATVEDTWYETYGERSIKTFKVVLDDEKARRTGALTMCHDRFAGSGGEHDLFLVPLRKVISFPYCV